MSKQYFVTTREECPNCTGVGVVQHPVWAEYWKQNKDVYHEMSESDDLEWLSNNSPYYHHMPHNEEMNCPQCEGKGEIEKEMDLLDALTELGVILSFQY